MGISSDMHSNFELSIFLSLFFTSIQLSIFLFAFDLLIDMLRLHNSLFSFRFLNTKTDYVCWYVQL